MIKKLLVILMLAATAVAITGCKTTEGFGEDVESAGESIQDASD